VTEDAAHEGRRIPTTVLRPDPAFPGTFERRVLTVMQPRLTRLAQYALIASLPFAAAPLRASAARDHEHPAAFRGITRAPDLVADDGPSVPKERLSAEWRKVSTPLRQLVVRAATAAKSGDRSALSTELCRVRPDGAVAATIRVSRFGADERAALTDAGCEVTFASESFRFVEAWVPVDTIERVAALDFVNGVRPADRGVAGAGSVTSEGDSILLAADARRTLGVTGRGVKVGVISDSVDGIETAIASGDVPPDVEILNHFTGAGEGTAMLEIVHDLAPDATLAFSGAQTQGDMVNAINLLADDGCQVIVDDLIFRGEPFFEDGPIGQTEEAAISRGIVYVNHAGNDAPNDDQFDFSGIGPIGGPTRNVEGFSNGSGGNAFVAPPHEKVGAIVQWSNPYGSAQDDYDVYLVDSEGTIVGKSDNPQDGDDDPLEVASVINNTDVPQTYYVVIDLYQGSPQRVNIMFTRNIGDLQFGTPAMSLGCAEKTRDAITVGAIRASDPGNDTIEFFSSQGPCDVFFPTYERRSKPDICGIDGVRITGAFGFDNPFYGTSAAAPHVAGIAALMLEADPLLDPASVKLSLERSAVDCGAPGFDLVYGAGRADAVDATIGYPNAEAAGIVGTRLVVQGTHFAAGAVILVNGARYRTKADPRSPTTALTTRAGARAIQPGQSVTLQVQNPDGRQSLPGSFER
jgi:subtilisin family serine protease